MVNIILICIGLYLLVGAIFMSYSWKEFRGAVLSTEADPNNTMPPPWACWILGVMVWVPAAIASICDKDRSE